jgi:hypothetical protein
MRSENVKRLLNFGWETSKNARTLEAYDNLKNNFVKPLEDVDWIHLPEVSSSGQDVNRS